MNKNIFFKDFSVAMTSQFKYVQNDRICSVAVVNLLFYYVNRFYQTENGNAVDVNLLTFSD